MQRDALIAAGVDPRDIWEEKASGATLKKRKVFEAMMKDVRPGDTVYVWKLDRLGRSLQDLLNVATAIKKKGANLYILTLPGLDTETTVGKIMFQLLAAFAEFERAIALERTMAGLAAARKAGRFGGNTSKFSDEEVIALQGLRPKEAAEKLGMSQPGYSKRLAAALGRAARGEPPVLGRNIPRKRP